MRFACPRARAFIAAFSKEVGGADAAKAWVKHVDDVIDHRSRTPPTSVFPDLFPEAMVAALKEQSRYQCQVSHFSGDSVEPCRGSVTFFRSVGCFMVFPDPAPALHSNFGPAVAVTVKLAHHPIPNCPGGGPGQFWHWQFGI